MNIVVFQGSPRGNGNTASMVKAFCEGALEAGNEVTVLEVAKMNIAGCKGCGYCRTIGNGSCIQKDDDDAVYQALKNAEMIVLASPIYYYTFSSQLQAAIQRTHAIGVPPKVVQAALFLSSGSPNVYKAAIAQYQSAVIEYYKVEDKGIITMNDTNKKAKENLDELRTFGLSIRA